jgi:hypothetical protein
MSRSYCQIAKARFRPSQFWKRALPCYRKSRIQRMLIGVALATFRYRSASNERLGDLHY